MSLMNAKWLDQTTVNMNKVYNGPDEPGNGDNILENGQSRLWFDTVEGAAKLVGRIGSTYYTTPLTDGIFDGGSF